MKLSRFVIALLVLAPAALGENPTPRDIWAQAATAAMAGDVTNATLKTNELITVGKTYGVTSYPAYAVTAAAMARTLDRAGKGDAATWAAKTALQLDPASPAVAFQLSDRARDKGQWPEAIRQTAVGFGRILKHYRTRMLAQADMLIAVAAALALATAIFAIALFIRYGHSMAHDFREFLAQRLRGGMVTVLAFALLFLPLFLWLGPLWLVFYWFVIFFGYASGAERALIVILCLVVAGLPIAMDRAASYTAAVDNPIVQATLLSSTQSYRPEALRRVQEFAAIVSDNDIVQILLGNLQLQEGNEQQALLHYRRANELKESAGAHVNLGNLHYLNNDFAAAITEYEKAEELDPKLAIAFYNNSLASGELYRFDEQGQKLEQAKKLNRSLIERYTQNPPPQKIVLYTPPLEQAWEVSTALARRGAAQTLFGTYSYFDLTRSAINPVTIGSIATILFALGVWQWRRKTGYANACIKCGRTFCHRCKSARESATYCTQCIHIYLKRDGVSLDTKKAKLEEVQNYLIGTVRRNKLFATFLPGSAQVLEGRTVTGAIGIIVFLLFVMIALLVGRLAPAIGPTGEAAKLLIRGVTIGLAAITWITLSLPVYRRKAASA